MKKPTTTCPTCGRQVSAALASLRPGAETLTCPGRGGQPRLSAAGPAVTGGLMQVIPTTWERYMAAAELNAADMTPSAYGRPGGFRAGGILPPFTEAKRAES